MQIENYLEGNSGSFVANKNGMRVGEATYIINPAGDLITITYVGVNPEHRGGGYAKQLVMAVVEYARKNGMKIRPVCSYARVVLERDDSLRDVKSI